MNFYKDTKICERAGNTSKEIEESEKITKNDCFHFDKNVNGRLFFLSSWFVRNSKHILTLIHFFKKRNCLMEKLVSGTTRINTTFRI